MISKNPKWCSFDRHVFFVVFYSIRVPFHSCNFHRFSSGVGVSGGGCYLTNRQQTNADTPFSENIKCKTFHTYLCIVYLVYVCVSVPIFFFNVKNVFVDGLEWTLRFYFALLLHCYCRQWLIEIRYLSFYSPNTKSIYAAMHIDSLIWTTPPNTRACMYVCDVACLSSV